MVIQIHRYNMKQTEEYYSLIKNWHAKASDEDYFSRFMFEYMAFTAYLKTQWKTEDQIKTMRGSSKHVTDRDYIQALKQDSEFGDWWADLAARSTKDKQLVKTLNELVKFLKKEPLTSQDERWWNFSGFELNQKPSTRKKPGTLEHVNDLDNIIEFWYSVRNNLFHGTKNPSIERDKELVRFAFLTLHAFVDQVLLVSTERHRVYPASWEGFLHRFKKGEAEINTRVDSRGGTGTIYDCAFLDEYKYPILLLDKKLSRNDIIDMINESFWTCGDDVVEEKWSRLKSAAGLSKKKELYEYFSETLHGLNSAYGLKLK